MPPIEILFAIGAAALGVGGLVFALVSLAPAASRRVEVEDAAAAGPRSPARPLSERVASAAPSGYVGWIQKQIVYAGRARDWTPGGFLVVKVICALVLGFVGIVWIVVGPNIFARPMAIVLGVFCILLGMFAPDILLGGRASDRQSAVQRALPDTLDQMTIAVEAGLGFDAAMAKAAQNGIGPLADELIRTIQDMSIGRRRREAYHALEARTDSEDLHRFIRAILQADAYGISIADVLRVQAGEMRLRRRQRAEEKAMSVPVKMVFPLVFCILPVLFIVLLTPAVLGLIAAFSR